VLDVFFGTDVLLPRFGISGFQTLQDGDGTFPLLRRRLSFDSVARMALMAAMMIVFIG
jgi:hypothetical protein